MTCVLGWELPCFAGTLHQHGNHGSNRLLPKYPFHVFSKQRGGRVRLFYVPFMSPTAVFEDASFQEPVSAQTVGSRMQMGVIRWSHKPKN